MTTLPALVLRSLAVLRRIFAAMAVLCFWSLLVTDGLAWSPGAALPTATTDFAVNPYSRRDVLAFYHTVYGASEGFEARSGWNGSVADLAPGTTSEALKKDVLRRVNFYRALAGLPADVILNFEKSAGAQEAALITARNGGLSHYPASEHPEWVGLKQLPLGVAASAQSNLSLGAYGPAAVDGQMRDDGEANPAVGHRRWLLFSKLAQIGTGDVPEQDGFSAANAIWVTGQWKNTASAQFVMWPNQGYTPANLLPKRWSVSYPDADFSGASVSMSRGGVAIPVRMIHRSTPATQNVLGEQTLVWEPTAMPLPASGDVAYSILVTDIRIGGELSSLSYNVVAFDPSDLGEPLSITGSGSLPPSGGSFVFNSVAQADAYQLTVARGSTDAWVEGAEGSSVQIVAHTTPGYAVVQSQVAGSGTRAFHLTHPGMTNAGFADQSFQLNRRLVPGPDSVLQFSETGRFAETTTTLNAEVSADDGQTWTTVWSRTGVGLSSTLFDAGWNPHAVRLRAYSGKAVLVRFSLKSNGGPVAAGTTQDYGFFIDNIVLTNGVELVEAKVTTIPGTATGFVLNSETAGASLREGNLYYLSVAPQIGTRLFASSPLKVASVAVVSAMAAAADALPVISAQPQPRGEFAGGTVTFSVAASGNGLGYQWRRNGTALSGGTAASLTISGVQAANAGNYDVLVSNSAGSVTSSFATLTVNNPPVIKTQPVSVVGESGKPVTLSVSATGTALGYQWQKNSVLIPGATAASYWIPAAGTADAGSYRVVVSSSVSDGGTLKTMSVTSDPASLSVLQVPQITVQPETQTVIMGGSATFKVVATGATSLTYQWRKGGVDLLGATSATYTISSAGVSQTGSYDVVVKDTNGKSVTSVSVNLLLKALPQITVQPLEAKVAAGFPAAFSVGVAGGGTWSYQWRKNGVAIAGGTFATYRIESAQKSDESYGGTAGYDVVVTGAAGSVTSARVGLSVVEGGAYIIENPSGSSVKLGSNYTMRVSTTDTEVTYQWRKNGVNIVGATSSSYTLSAIKDTDAGRYDVVVHNAFGDVCTPPAYVGVASKVVPNLQKATYNWVTLAGNGLPGSANGTGLAAQFNNPSSIAIDGLGNIYVSDTDNHAIRKVTQAGVVTTVAGSLGTAGSKDGSALSTARFDSPQGIAVDKAGAVYIAEPNNNTVRKLTSPGLSTATVTTVAGVAGQFGVAGGLNSPSKVALDPTGNLYVLDNSSIRKVVSTTQFTLLFGELPEAYTGTQPGPMAMAVDGNGKIFAAANAGGEFKIFSRVSGGTFAATNFGPYPFPMTDLALGGGSNLYAATESAVELLGDISQSTPATGLPVNLTDQVNGYASPRAVAVDADGILYAVDPFLNTVIKGVPAGLPVFVLHPAGASGTDGVPLTLSAVAVGAGTIAYQWYRDGVAILGATESSYTMPSGGSGGGVYSVDASNTAGTVSSTSAAVLGSSTPLGILKDPQSATVVSGGSVAFEVGWRGPSATTFQWYKNGAALSGATSSIYSFSAVKASDAGDYKVELKSVTNGTVSTLVSGTAKLVVNIPASIFAQPEDVAVALHTSVSLKVSATGTQPLTYQWRKNGQPIAGATLPTYDFVAEGPASYDVQVNNVVGAPETSRTAMVSVLTPPTIKTQPLETQTVNQGAAATFTVSAEGSAPLSFQWRKEGAPIAGGTSATLTLATVQAGDAGSYDVLVSNALGSVASKASKLSVNLPASILSQPPSSISATIGTPVLLRVVAGGTGPFTYQWYRKSGPIPGADQPSYLASTAEAGTVQYSVSVKSLAFGNTVQSAETTLTVSAARGVSILRAPSAETNVIKGTAAGLKLTVDPTPSDAVRTTYKLFTSVNNAPGVDTGIGGIVPASGEFEVPLKTLSATGSYMVVFSREYADGEVISSVKSASFTVRLNTLDDAAGTYEVLLADSNGLVGDGATYRGVLLATVSKTGSVTGRVLYNEAAPLSGATAGERTYTAVARSFSATFTPSANDPSKLVCAPKLGLGTQANRQALELELDFTTAPVELNALVRDRISVDLAQAEEGCVSQGSGAIRVATKLSEVSVGATKKDLGSLVGRYALGSDFGLSQGSGPGADNNATLLVQVLSTGKVLWASRLSGYSGSGSASLSTRDGDTVSAQFYEGRTLSTTTALSTNSLLGQLQFHRATGGTLWTAGVTTLSSEDKLERQSCYITKVNKVPVYEDVRFDVSSMGYSSYNWSGVQALNFQYGTSCLWTGSTSAGLVAFLNPAGSTSLSTLPPLYLTAEDPAGEGTYVWTISVSSTGVVKATNYSATDVQPVLTLRLDKVRGEWTGSYVSPSTKMRRSVVGVVARPEGGDALRGAGWVEMGAVPATQTSGWKLEWTAP